jgi:outer membrane lipoprotein
MVKFLQTRGVSLGIVFLLGLSCCSLPISMDLQREANRDLSFVKVSNNPAAYIGNTVIWGGVILQVQDNSDGTEIRVRQNPLKSNESPDTESTEGEFIALTGESLDPNVFKIGKKITVGGEIIGEKTENTQTTRFTYPVIQIKEYYLWSNGNKWWEPRPSSGWLWKFPVADQGRGGAEGGALRFW